MNPHFLRFCSFRCLLLHARIMLSFIWLYLRVKAVIVGCHFESIFFSLHGCVGIKIGIFFFHQFYMLSVLNVACVFPSPPASCCCVQLLLQWWMHWWILLNSPVHPFNVVFNAAKLWVTKCVRMNEWLCECVCKYYLWHCRITSFFLLLL